MRFGIGEAPPAQQRYVERPVGELEGETVEGVALSGADGLFDPAFEPAPEPRRCRMRAAPLLLEALNVGIAVRVGIVEVAPGA